MSKGVLLASRGEQSGGPWGMPLTLGRLSKSGMFVISICFVGLLCGNSRQYLILGPRRGGEDVAERTGKRNNNRPCRSVRWRRSFKKSPRLLLPPAVVRAG